MAQQTDHIGEFNKMITAVEWLIQKINQDYPEMTWAYKEECEQAKAIEKEQIMKAVYDTMEFDPNIEIAEKYYNETYENNP